MNKEYKPFLAPNEKTDIYNINYPLLSSEKLDGIRCIFHPTRGMISRSLKPIKNKQLKERFSEILEISKQTNLILDGEIYSPELSFQDIQRYVMTEDFTSEKSIKKFGMILNVPEHLKFYLFDCLDVNNMDESFSKRIERIKDISNEHLVLLKQTKVDSPLTVKQLYDDVVERGGEGLILKNPNGRYKFGRATMKENLMFKLKPFIDFVATIKAVEQATAVDPNAEKTTNELGYSVTSKKKDDRVLIEKASGFVVDYEGNDLIVNIKADDITKKDIWTNKEKYIGKEVNYKAMLVGIKELPRHPVATKWWSEDE